MLELIAEGLLSALVIVAVGLALEEVIGQPQAIAWMQCAVCRQGAVIAAVGVMLQISLQGQ
ncbi:hypothetical protein D9M71_799240 [compost metagenome]